MMNIRNEPYNVQSCLYVAGLVYQLYKKKLIGEPPYDVTVKGLSKWDQLHEMVKSGELFVPDEDVRNIMYGMSDDPTDEDHAVVEAIIMLCRKVMDGELDII